MSNIYYAHSIKPMLCNEFFEEINTHKFIYANWPYLKNKNFIYEFNMPLSQCDSFLQVLRDCVNANIHLVLVVLEELHEMNDVIEFNTKMIHKEIVKIQTKEKSFYDFKYAIEKNLLKRQTEYFIE